MDFFKELVSNRALVVPFLAWTVAQALKFFGSAIRNREFDYFLLVQPGGMPSAHTTLVCALATSTAILYGINSPFFAISAILAGIVMYDATSVRRTVGSQSALLNRILDELLKGKPAFDERLRELIGHTPMEVIAGAALGIFLALIIT